MTGTVVSSRRKLLVMRPVNSLYVELMTELTEKTTKDLYF